MKSRELSLFPFTPTSSVVRRSLKVCHKHTHTHSQPFWLLLAQNFLRFRLHSNPSVYTPLSSSSSSSSSPVTSHRPAVLSKLHIWKENWSDDQPRTGIFQTIRQIPFQLMCVGCRVWERPGEHWADHHSGHFWPVWRETRQNDKWHRQSWQRWNCDFFLSSYLTAWVSALLPGFPLERRHVGTGRGRGHMTTPARGGRGCPVSSSPIGRKKTTCRKGTSTPEKAFYLLLVFSCFTNN